MAWSSFSKSFAWTTNLEVNATDTPDLRNVTSMNSMFYESGLTGNKHFNDWDTSNVTNFHRLFCHARKFNEEINDWNVSKVTNMETAFWDAEVFNQDLNKWDVSSVTNMYEMFGKAVAFNQPLGDWNISSVTNIRRMFKNASSFNQPLGNWDVSRIVNMDQLFINATAFNQPLAAWDVSNVTIMSDVFQNADSFNQPLATWNVSNVTNMSYMFAETDKFDQLLGEWNVSKVTNMSGVFWKAAKFNQDISSWDVSKVTDITSMFRNASGFINHDLSKWDIGSVRKNKYANFMQNAGSGNTEPNWLPSDIISRARVSFTNISWWDGDDTKNRNCIKYRLDCLNRNDFKVHTNKRVNQSISFKFNKSYHGGKFEYHNRDTTEPNKENIGGSKVEFLLGGAPKDYDRIADGRLKSVITTDVEFDEVRIDFTDANQHWRDIKIIANPDP
jgi:surface protein